VIEGLHDASALGGICEPAAICPRCGAVITVGMWPVCDLARGKDHGVSVQTDPFVQHFDFALGAEVTSLGDRRRLMKDLHLDYRDKMSAGDLSARRDRVEAAKREEAR